MLMLSPGDAKANKNSNDFYKQWKRVFVRQHMNVYCCHAQSASLIRTFCLLLLSMSPVIGPWFFYEYEDESRVRAGAKVNNITQLRPTQAFRLAMHPGSSREDEEGPAIESHHSHMSACVLRTVLLHIFVGC